MSARISTGDFAFGRCVIQAAARQLRIDGEPVRLGARAFDVLMTLVERRDHVVSKNDLLDIVWPGLVVEENNLQVHISTLRKLLGAQTIATLPGHGYRFTASLHDAQPDPLRASDSGQASSLHSNLPEQLPPLFGRKAELEALAEMLPKHRLITITGAGGIGKTRLAQAAAQAALDRYPDGVWWVELATANAPEQILGTVARVLEIALDLEATASDLGSRIAERHLLLVLDNCEHLIAGVAVLASTLLCAASNVSMLVTSQDSLKVEGEQVMRLGTLAVPDDATEAEHAVTQDFGAMTLFAARAREATPHFVIDDGNRAAVIEICRRLDGIPLAIEFAAARLPLLGVEGLRLRLDDRFRLLVGGARLAPKRQQTLRAAMDWSHSLLSPNEQKVFRRLAVFSGSFRLNAAQQVAAQDDFDRWTALDHLAVLVDKSLVISEFGGVPRYRLLESTRAFALERLHGAGEASGAAQHHALALLQQFEAAYAQRWTVKSEELLASVRADIDNLRAALTWAAGDAGDIPHMAALVGASSWVWKPANLTAEGVRWHELALARVDLGASMAAATPVVPPAIEARLLLVYAMLASQTAAQKELAALHRAAMLFRAIGDQHGLYEALTALAQKQVWAHDLSGATHSIDEAAALWRARWPPAMQEGLLLARTYLLEVSGRPADGQPLMEALVALMREVGDERKLDLALMQLAESLFVQGKTVETIAVRREVARRIGGRRVNYAGPNLGNLCAALTLHGELDEAQSVARAALPLLQREGAMRTYEDHFALLACKQGRHPAAARLLGRSNANFLASGFEREESEQRAARVAMAELGKALATDELYRMLAEGATMTDEAAIRVALGMDRRVAGRA